MKGNALSAGLPSIQTRYTILLMLFVTTTLNYADRASLSIAGSSLQAELGIDAVTLGYIFSAFAWAYVAAQIPGGWLLDRFGSRRVYAVSILLWSLFTLLGCNALVAVISYMVIVGPIERLELIDKNASGGLPARKELTT